MFLQSNFVSSVNVGTFDRRSLPDHKHLSLRVWVPILTLKAHHYLR